MEYALFHLLWIPIGVGTARLGLLWKRAKETKEKFLVQRQETIIKYPQQRPPVSMKILNAKNQIRCSICNLLVGVEERKTNGGLCKRHFSELSEQDRAYFSMLFRSYAFTKWWKIGLYILFILVGFVTIVLSLLVGGFTSIALWGLFTFSALSTSTGIILFFVTTPEDREREWKRFLGGKIFTEIGIKSWESPNGLEETLKPCNSCGRENPHDAHYCNICGKVLD